LTKSGQRNHGKQNYSQPNCLHNGFLYKLLKGPATTVVQDQQNTVP
jgi:hypothetical protein